MDTRQTSTAFRIGDQQVLGVECAVLLVQRGEVLACLRLAHDDLPALQLVGIEGVQGLAQLMLHEVGDVHHVVDRLEADALQALLLPCGR